MGDEPTFAPDFRASKWGMITSVITLNGAKMAIRVFTSQLDDQIAGRPLDDDAPSGLRQEFLDAALHFLEVDPAFREARLYGIISQSLGVAPSGQPYGGYRYAMGRDVNRADWQRVYDLICRLWPEVSLDSREGYRTAVNRILAAHRVAWDLGEDGLLHRVLPPAVQGQVGVTT